MDKKIGLGEKVFPFLNIPKCPKKEWDGKESFAFGVAVVHRTIGTEEYAVCKFDSEKEEKPRIIKDFGHSSFDGIITIYPVPAYLDEDVESFDLDDASKQAVKDAIEDKKAIIESSKEKVKEEICEWGYEFIHSKEEAIAYLKTLKLKGKIPEREDAIKSKLQLLFREENKK